MPLYDFVCDACGIGPEEHLLRRWDDPDPECGSCGGRMRRLVPRAKPCWLKGIHEFFVPRNEDEAINWTPDGVWVTRVKSSRNPDGSPERCLIRTHKEMRRFCREEGLVPPDDVDQKV